MKKSIIASLLMLTTAFAFAQDKAAKPESWPELKDFHTVMSQTFHPSQEGNLKPIKERIGEMVTKAQALQKSKAPAEFNNDKVKDAVTRLANGSVELKAKIDKKDSDKEITQKLSSLHDIFHEIVELCQKGEGDHDEHGHDSDDGHKH